MSAYMSFRLTHSRAEFSKSVAFAEAYHSVLGPRFRPSTWFVCAFKADVQTAEITADLDPEHDCQ